MTMCWVVFTSAPAVLYFGVERFTERQGVLLGDAVRVGRIFPVGL